MDVLAQIFRKVSRTARQRAAAAGVIALVIAAPIVAVALGTRSVGIASDRTDAFADVPGVLQRALAQRYCARGDGTTGELPQSTDTVGDNPGTLVPAQTGALIAAVRRALDDAAATPEPGRGAVPLVGALHPLNLVRPTRPELPGWRSRSYAVPEQLGFELEGTVAVDRVAFWHVPAFAEASWARDVVLYLSTQGPDRGFYKLGGWRLAATTRPQVLALPFPTAARYVRLCILSTHGEASYVSLGGFAIGVVTGTSADSLPPGPPASLF